MDDNDVIAGTALVTSPRFPFLSHRTLQQVMQQDPGEYLPSGSGDRYEMFLKPRLVRVNDRDKPVIG